MLWPGRQLQGGPKLLPPPPPPPPPPPHLPWLPGLLRGRTRRTKEREVWTEMWRSHPRCVLGSDGCSVCVYACTGGVTCLCVQQPKVGGGGGGGGGEGEGEGGGGGGGGGGEGMKEMEVKSVAVKEDGVREDGVMKGDVSSEGGDKGIEKVEDGRRPQDRLAVIDRLNEPEEVSV